MKNDITYEYRVFTNRLIDVEAMEVGICTSKVVKELNQKNKVDGRFFHTSDTDEWFFCWNGELQKLKYKKEQVLLDIEEYDNSESVNQCVIKQGENEFYYWANKSERSTLKTAIQDCLTMGIETYRLDLRELGVSFTIPCQNMLQMLSALEVYAIQCYNKTTDHIFNVRQLENMEDVENYDFTQGYPEKLIFNI